MSLKSKVEDHPVVFFLGTLAIGFAAGFGTFEKLSSILTESESSPKQVQRSLKSDFIEKQIADLTKGLNERLTGLQGQYLQEQKEATDHASMDSYRENHRRAAEALAQQIAAEKSSFVEQVNALRSIDCAP